MWFQFKSMSRNISKLKPFHRAVADYMLNKGIVSEKSAVSLLCQQQFLCKTSYHTKHITNRWQHARTHTGFYFGEIPPVYAVVFVFVYVRVFWKVSENGDYTHTRARAHAHTHTCASCSVVSVTQSSLLLWELCVEVKWTVSLFKKRNAGSQRVYFILIQTQTHVHM